MRVQEIMSSPVLTVTPGTGVKEAAALLVERGFTALPVVDAEGRLVGIVTEADLMPLETTADPRSHMAPLQAGQQAGRLPGTVAEVMTREVVALSPDAYAAQAAQVMLARHLRSVPVTDEGKVVGVVTRRDLLRVLARSDEEIRRELIVLLAEELPDEPVAVAISGGAVTLTFASPLGREERRIAELLASTVPGVLSVRSA
ncbi:MAG TPA: CBS domain-containing protein [Actinomycetes bacterium]|nr:CBS domain-containing protein [Actinomycetes bacterium]